MVVVVDEGDHGLDRRSSSTIGEYRERRAKIRSLGAVRHLAFQRLDALSP
jgi:hypothetical protein